MVDSNSSLFHDTEQRSLDCILSAAQKATFSAYFIAIIFVGSCGNGAIVFTIWRNVKLHSAAYALIANLAVADFLVCGVLMPLHVGMFARGVIPGIHHPWCQAEAFLILITEGVSLLSVAAVAFNRYATICNNTWKKWLTTRFIGAVILAIWLYTITVASVIALLAALDIERLQVQVNLSCFASERIVYVMYVVFMFAPFTVTVVSYLKIYLFLRHERRRVGLQPMRQRKQKRNDDARVLQSIVAVTGLYSMCVFVHVVLKYILPLVVDHAYHSGIQVGSWCVLLISNWTSVILYFIWNPTFRRAFLVAFKVSAPPLEVTERTDTAR